jgi:hypothetical protein
MNRRSRTPKWKLLRRNLKCCPLCGSLNVIEAGSCYQCSWHGSFEHDEVAVDRAFATLVEQSPELADMLIATASRTRGTQFRDLVKKLLIRIDIQV